MLVLLGSSSARCHPCVVAASVRVCRSTAISSERLERGHSVPSHPKAAVRMLLIAWWGLETDPAIVEQAFRIGGECLGLLGGRGRDRTEPAALSQASAG